MRAIFPLIPSASTSMAFVQVSGFDNIGLLTRRNRLVCDSYSSSLWLVYLQLPSKIPLHSGCPYHSANCSPFRASGGLASDHHAYQNSTSKGAEHHAWCTIKKRGTKVPRFIRFKLSESIRSQLPEPHRSCWLYHHYRHVQKPTMRCRRDSWSKKAARVGCCLSHLSTETRN